MHAVFLAGLLLGLGPVAELGGLEPTDPAVWPATGTVGDQLAEAGSLLDHGRYIDAIALLDRILAEEPNLGPALAARAGAYAWTNRLEEADRDIAAAARAMPETAMIHRVRAIIAQRRSDNATALAEYSRALALEPNDPFSLRIRSHLYQRAGNSVAALADIETLIAAFPDDPDHVVLKAELLVEQRARPQAAAEAERLVTRFPEHPHILAAAARIHDSLADRARAMALVDRAIALDPGTYPYHVLRAGIRRWDDVAGRRTDLTAALALDPENASIIVRAALLDFQQRNWRDAIARFSAVLAREPNDFGLLAYRAMARLNAGERAAAERDHRAAIAVAAGADDFAVICGSFAREGFALEWGMAACNRAVRLNATDGTFRANRGLIALRLGRLDAALADYTAAIAADRRLAQAFYGRALVHQRRGAVREAQADRAEALAIDPAIAESFQSYGFTDF